MNKLSMRFEAIGWPSAITLFIIVFVAAAGVRLYSLDSLPVFVDEAIYVRWAQIMRAEPTLRFLPLSDGKQPLFMWATMPALKFFSDPLIAGRIVSVATGLGTLTGVFALSLVLFNSKKLALFAAALYAFSPFAIFYDRLALVDSMLSFFGVWTLLLSLLAVKHLSLGLAFMAGFALGGAFLTKSPALFFFFFLPSSLLFVPGHTSRRLVNIFKAAGLLLVAAGTSFAMYNILRLGPNFHLVSSRNLDYVHPVSRIFTNPLDPFVPNLEQVLNWFSSLGPISLVLLLVVGAYAGLQKYKKETVVLLLWAFAPILVQSEYAIAFTSRYVLFSLPAIVVLASCSLIKTREHPRVYLAYILALVFAIQSLLFISVFLKTPLAYTWPERDGFVANWTAGTGIKEVAEIIKARSADEPDRHTVVGTEGYFGTLPDGLQIYLSPEPGITVIGVGLGISEIPESLANAAEAGDMVFLVANSSRLNFKGSWEENGLAVVAEIEKPARTPGTHDYVNSGPQDTFYLLEVL